jgi:hypothetical protein
MTAKMRAISEVEPPLSGATGDRRALLFANRKSGLGSVELGDVVGLLQDRGMTVMSVSPDTPAQIPDLIRSDASNADLVIIGGGDGTLNGCLPALIECQLPIGILPTGVLTEREYWVGAGAVFPISGTETDCRAGRQIRSTL